LSECLAAVDVAVAAADVAVVAVEELVDRQQQQQLVALSLLQYTLEVDLGVSRWESNSLGQLLQI